MSYVDVDWIPVEDTPTANRLKSAYINYMRSKGPRCYAYEGVRLPKRYKILYENKHRKKHIKDLDSTYTVHHVVFLDKNTGEEYLVESWKQHDGLRQSGKDVFINPNKPPKIKTVPRVTIGSVWCPHGHNTRWKVLSIDGENVCLTRVDIYNPGWGSEQYSKVTSRQHLIKLYERVE